MSASAPTPESSPSRASDAGGARSALRAIQAQSSGRSTPDCGGSNAARLRLWKRELQVLADELAIEISVCHVPPGTSKWNKIEHRLFSFITQNWRGKPLISYLVIVQLIASTTTDKGLTVACRLDESDYAKGIKVTDAEMAALNIQPADFHGEWNYTIAPRRPDG